jgi:hypothetical protein
MSLSACFLTRNEEATIGPAVRSVSEIADEIVVVDTHSRDETADRAAEAGARVLQYEWADDFGAGRNFSIRQASGDWILWLNGTEQLTPESQPLVRNALDQANVFGYFVRIRTPLSDEAKDGQAETMDVRLFRRRDDLHFIGRAHPHFEQALVEKIRGEGLQVLPSNITLQASWSPEPLESKLRFAVRLLELELQDRPGQLHYMIELGQALLRLNEPRAHQVMAEAAQVMRTHRAEATPPGVKTQALLAYLLQQQPDTSREEVRELAWRWFPSSPRLLHQIAEDAFARREFRFAAQILERLVQLGQTGRFDRSHIFDPDLVGERARINLAACYYSLGEAVKAEQLYRSLLASQKYGQIAAQGLAASQQLQRQRGGFSFDASVDQLR